MASRTRRHAGSADDVTQESLDLTTAEETLTMYFMAFGYRHCSNDNKGRRFCAMFKGNMVPSCLMPDNGNRCLLCKWTLYADQMSNTTLQDRILLMAPETAASIRDLWPSIVAVSRQRNLVDAQYAFEDIQHPQARAAPEPSMTLPSSEDGLALFPEAVAVATASFAMSRLSSSSSSASASASVSGSVSTGEIDDREAPSGGPVKRALSSSQTTATATTSREAPSKRSKHNATSPSAAAAAAAVAAAAAAAAATCVNHCAPVSVVLMIPFHCSVACVLCVST
jgi:hypothetical protein